MMICEAIETLLYTKSYGTVDIAKSVAIDTMKKYRKIEEIIRNWKDGTLGEKDSIYAFHKIIEVVEDGNTN